VTYRCFDVEVEDKVGYLTLCRPEDLNTLVPQFWSELPEIVERLSADGGVRVLVLSSTGRHFTAGMDLAVFADEAAVDVADPGRGALRRAQNIRRMQASITVLETARLPVIAAIQGGCVGGGIDIASACDLRYATADAFFVVQETNIGITADLGTLQRLPKLIPDGIAREMIFTGRRLPAARAYEVGLVSEVFADAAAMAAGVREIAGEIAAKSPIAIWGAKELIVHARDHGVADGLRLTASWNAGSLQAPDIAEAITARAERRTANFADLADSPTEREGQP
jgi:enoyl-CoA hydratase